VAICLGLSSLVCGGCYDFDSPIDASPSHAIDSSLLGTWRCLGDDQPDSQPVNFVVTSPRERAYSIIFEAPGERPSAYEAYSSKVKDGVVLNVRDLSPRFPSKPWTLARYSFLLPHVLRVQLVDDEKLKNIEQSPAALRAAIERLADQPDLYVEFCICVRVRDTSKGESPDAGHPRR
jgi:hypothetical protein